MIRCGLLVVVISLCAGCLENASPCEAAIDDNARMPADNVAATWPKACVNDDGAYCETPSIAVAGACIGNQCMACMAFVCKGVDGCSSSAMFARNGNVGHECPDGCFSACSL
jgi:hypothetical protein